jgi:hypothetical protein
LFRGIGITAVAEFDQDIQARFRGHRSVITCIGLIGVFESGEYLTRFSTPIL